MDTSTWRFSSNLVTSSQPVPPTQPAQPAKIIKKDNPEKRGWRVREWYPQVGISRAWTWRLIKDGKIRTVKLGRARIIVTPPSEFLSKLKPPA